MPLLIDVQCDLAKLAFRFVQLQPPYQYKDLDRFYSTLSFWALTHPSHVLQADSREGEADIHNISYLSLPLALSFSRISTAVKDASLSQTVRRGMDDLVEMAFSGRIECINEVL